MKLVKKLTVELTREEYDLLQEASALLYHLASEIDFDEFEHYHDLRGAEGVISEFLEDENVEVEADY